MSEFILHHYALSPFSTKIRAMLGQAGLDWRSAITREMPPRPVLEVLAGGYRKIPVAQIGADVFCDTRVIAEEIARLSGQPQLALAGCEPDARELAARADSALFVDCLMAGSTLTAGRRMWAAMSALDIARFFVDRIRVGRHARIKARSPQGAPARIRGVLAELSERLHASPFLFGEQPCHADFSVYHTLWFLTEVGGSTLVNEFPRVRQWQQRLRQQGEGRAQPLAPEDTLLIARLARPRALPADQVGDSRIGRQVRIAPVDYAREPTFGVLVAATPTRWILAREHAEVGLLHVHFPRDGYQLDEA